MKDVPLPVDEGSGLQLRCKSVLQHRFLHGAPAAKNNNASSSSSLRAIGDKNNGAGASAAITPNRPKRESYSCYSWSEKESQTMDAMPVKAAVSVYPVSAHAHAQPNYPPSRSASYTTLIFSFPPARPSFIYSLLHPPTPHHPCTCAIESKYYLIWTLPHTLTHS